MKRALVRLHKRGSYEEDSGWTSNVFTHENTLNALVRRGLAVIKKKEYGVRSITESGYDVNTFNYFEITEEGEFLAEEFAKDPNNRRTFGS